MKFSSSRLALATLTLLASGWTAVSWQTNSSPPLEAAFAESVQPFLKKNCAACHNADNSTAGVRVDHLDAGLDDKHIRLWEGILHRVKAGTMPPNGLPQPSAAERQKIVEWIGQALETARLRPTPKNGSARRLTVAQYRNTLRELLKIDDDFTEILPPDAVSKDGFVNNQETLQLSPLLVEAYLEIAEDALNRVIVEPSIKPSIQNFRMDFGAGLNKNPIPDELILGANSLLLENQDFTVTELAPKKPFAFEPFRMLTKLRFIEGYQGNDTVRGWRDFDSIYHAVFACMRGSRGYPKGRPYDLVPEGMLLRPAIPNDELFEADGTYGPKANFKISLRELPDNGRFRVTVTAAKYQDALLLDKGAPSQPSGGLAAPPGATVQVPQAGIYQVDVYQASRETGNPAPDATRLHESLLGAWPSLANNVVLRGEAKQTPSPLGQAYALDGRGDSVEVPRDASLNVGSGDFTVSAWILPKQIRRAGIASSGGAEAMWSHGWYLETPGNNGALHFETSGPENQGRRTLVSAPGVLRAETWQHIAAVVRRGKDQTRLYVNGYAVAKGTTGHIDIDNLKHPLRIGRSSDLPAFPGEIADLRLYRRALSEAELQALIEPGRQFAIAPRERTPDLKLSLGHRHFSGTHDQPAFLVLRLPAGPLRVEAESTGLRKIDRLVLTPLDATHESARRFAQFEKRIPKLGVHLGLRRDCGSTVAPVGPPQKVGNTQFQKYIFEGAIQNYPSPDVEKDNVNYLAGIREIAVRSEYTDGRDMPRLLLKSVEFEGPFYESWPPPPHKNIFTDFARPQDQPAYARHIIRNFAERAFRRPISREEENSLVAVFDHSFAASKNFTRSVKDSLQVVLTSPQFLFLIEKSATPAPEPLDNSELASKLSYFLWNGPPDRHTLNLAAAGTLKSQLNAEVERLIAHPRFSKFLEEFAAQWLALDKFQVLEADKKRYPDMTRENRAQLKQEPVQYLRHLIRENLPVAHLVRSDFIVANETVASYYGLGAKTESGFDFVPIAHGRQDLGGLLSQAALMAGLSDGRESNPIKRGAWLARRIIAEPPADPPPNVPALKEEETNLTLRQRLEQHRNQSGCLQCHTKIDPWGVALEEFDAGGRWKTHAVDAKSTLPDHTEVNGANDLKRYLAETRVDQVAFSVLKHLATYANGRSLTFYELNQLRQESAKLKPTSYRFKDMIHLVAQSKLFLEK
jgi:mono/diheme cytochrome c family protein